MDEKVMGAMIAFSHCMGIGPIRFKKLLENFDSILNAYEAPKNRLIPFLGNDSTNKFCEFRKQFNPKEKIDELRMKKIQPICYGDIHYPPQFYDLSDPPICLYVKGNIDCFNFSKDHFFGIVGTRRPSSYGQTVARKFGHELSKAGFVIVSGMAIGIDTVAHYAALRQGGRTIAFLGCGVDIIYPRENSLLYEWIIQKGGIVASEFPPGMFVQKGLFIARNRLISGLSKGLMVVEGLKDSGSLVTARYAAEQGKTVFAPPSPLTSVLSEAPNLLLKEGARFVTSTMDILEEFQMSIIPAKEKLISSTLIESESNVFEMLSREALSLDDLIMITKKSPPELLRILSSLEIQSLIEINNEGKYQVKML